MNIKTQKSGDQSTNIQAENIEINFTTHISKSLKKIETEDGDKKNIIDLINKNKLSEAEKELDKISEKLHMNMSNDLLEIADLYTLVNKEKAEKNYKRAIALSPNNPLVLNTFALYLMDSGKVPDAISFFNKALNKTKDNEVKEKIIGNLAVLYKNTGDIDKAITLQKEALEISNTRDPDITKARHLNNLGSCYWNIGIYTEAEKVLNKSLDLVSLLSKNINLRDNKKEIKLVKSNILTNLAIVCRHQFIKTNKSSYLEKAKQYLELAIDIAELIDDRSVLGRHYGNLSNIYRLQCDYDESQKMAEQALSCFRESGSLKDEMTSLMNLGVSYFDKKEYVKSIKYYEESLRLDKDEHFSRIHALTNEAFADSYKALNENSKEEKFARKAYELYQKLGLTTFMSDISDKFPYLNKE